MKKILPFLALLGLVILSFPSCNSTKKVPLKTEEVELPGQVYVWLTETAKVEKIELAFSEYELKSKGPASRTERKYLFVFGESLISSSALIKKLEAHRGVTRATVVMMTKTKN